MVAIAQLDRYVFCPIGVPIPEYTQPESSDDRIPGAFLDVKRNLGSNAITVGIVLGEVHNTPWRTPANRLVSLLDRPHRTYLLCNRVATQLVGTGSHPSERRWLRWLAMSGEIVFHVLAWMIPQILRIPAGYGSFHWQSR